MSNGNDSDKAIRALNYGSHNSPERDAYNVAYSEIMSNFKTFLDETHGSKFSKETRTLILGEAWGAAHDEGLAGVERAYVSFADFTQAVLDANK